MQYLEKQTFLVKWKVRIEIVLVFLITIQGPQIVPMFRVFKKKQECRRQGG